jgi:uncharacterized protein
VILEAIIGSHAYGLATEESDVDRRGVFVAPTEAFWRLEKPPTSVEGPSPEQLSWEVEHFCKLGLKSNPTVLETLVSPLVEIITPMGEELRALLPAFLSRYAVRAFTRGPKPQAEAAHARRAAAVGGAAPAADRPVRHHRGPFAVEDPRRLDALGRRRGVGTPAR